MSEMKDVMRHYFNIGTHEKPDWILLGDGITSMTEEFNPESETKQYINQKNGTTNVKSYTPSMSVEREYISDKLQKWWDEKVKVLPTGSSASSEYVRINLMDTPTAEGAYPAVLRKCTYQFDSVGGDAGHELVNAMTLGGAGDGIQGTFVVTEGSEAFTAV